MSVDGAIYADLVRAVMRSEDLDLLFGPKTDRMVRFDEYRLGDCIEERDRLLLRRRWADARFVKL